MAADERLLRSEPAGGAFLSDFATLDEGQAELAEAAGLTVIDLPL